MAHNRTVLLAILILLFVAGCSNSPIQQPADPSPTVPQPTPTLKPTEVAVAIPVQQPTAKLPVEELAQSGELDTIESVTPPEALTASAEEVVPQPAASDNTAAVGQPEIESPGRAEPPRPGTEAKSDVQVNFFRFAKQIEKPSEPTVIEWNVDGVESVQITRYGGKFGEAGEQWTVPAAGTMQHTFPPTTGGFEITYLLTSLESQSVSDQFNLTVPCEYTWVFDFRDPSLLCPGKPVISEAAFQMFEGGIMLWFDATDTILYTSWDGSISAEVPDTYEHGVDLVSDPLYAAPEGYYQPDYGLGKVWRTYPEARIALGWAISPNFGYEAVRQAEPVVPFGDIDQFITLPGDGFLHLQTEGDWDVQYDVPEITLADQRPQVEASVIPTPEPTSPFDPNATVNYFRFNPPPGRPSDNVTLEWSVDGVSSINIQRIGGDNGEANETFTDLPAEGSLAQTFPIEVGGMPVVYTLTSDELTTMSLEFVIDMPCEFTWAITSSSDECPTRPVVSFGAQQNFENGFMVWIQEEDIIIYGTWDGAFHGVVEDNYQHGFDIVSDVTQVPPSGLIQPEYGFGKVWREETNVRNMLGWAVSVSQDYEVRHQTTSSDTASYIEYVTLFDGGRIVIEHPSQIWTIE